MPSRARSAAAALFLVMAGVGHERVEADPLAQDTTGTASWYGDELAGARTASGSRFDPAAITAAHRSLPLGSFAEVTSLDTGKSILVLVNDRGPHRKDRIIDLSRGAAQQLGMGRKAVAQVRVRAVTPSLADAIALRAGKPAALRVGDPVVIRAASMAVPPPPSPVLDATRRYRLQVASFSSEDRARALAKLLDAEIIENGMLWRVRIGPLKASEVQRARDAVADRGYGDAQILPAD